MKVKVTVEKSPDGTWAAFMVDEMPDFGLAGYGHSPENAIDDFYCSLKETEKIMAQRGKTIPEMDFSFSLL